jgi:photosystem II stability/assembly factor-like uncharacterized protein
MKKRYALIAIILVLLTPSQSVASGETIGSISHIHHIKAFGKQVLLGTHEGLFAYIDKDTVKRLGDENFDIMGLSTSGRTLFASGHPGPGSKLPEPVGLLRSTNTGKSWSKVSLQSEVDFHLLESSATDIYGIDSRSGNLLHSSDRGKSWSNRGKSTFTDIAPHPTKKQSALALKDGTLFATDSAFVKSRTIPTKERLISLDWINGQLMAAAGKSLLRSTDNGATWKTIKGFSDEIVTITQSKELIVVVTPNQIQISRDQGKSFTSK